MAEITLLMDELDEEEDCTVAVCIMLTQKKEREWVHPINADRPIVGEFHHLMPQLLDDEERFLKYYRMTRNEFYKLLNLVAPKLRKCDTQLRRSESVEERLAVCLRFLATGNSYRSLRFSFRLGFSTVGKIVKECCQVLWETLQPMYFPEPDKTRWKELAQEFETLWHFPHCIGALDGKHIQIRCPDRGGSAYYNYKGTHSIVLLALVDAKYRFIMIDVGSYGRSSDGGTFQRSTYGQRFCTDQLNIPTDNKLTPNGDTLPFVVVADEAFPLKRNMMRPYSRNTRRGDDERVFNYRLSRARRAVENAFGMLAGRWRIFLKPIETQPETDDVVLAACCLHNMLRTSSSKTAFEEYAQIPVQDICAFEDMQAIRRNHVREATFVREQFKRYFVSENGSASCPWQWERIRKGRQPQ